MGICEITRFPITNSYPVSRQNREKESFERFYRFVNLPLAWRPMSPT
jgi:hypothetical protein